MRSIGRYEIEGEIGRGAMGVVYLARDPRVRRAVALKTCLAPDGLPPERQREYQERFLREAQSAGALDHPAIVTIYDAGEDPASGLPYIAMEYVDGETLRDRMRREGTLPVEKACRLVADLAAGLHAAHAAGVVHRDIKPANILLRAGDGAAKIADFGVARLDTSELTRSGQSLGSPAYMSPEQIRGGEVDGRSDLFSLAVILYQVLCGRRPFAGEDLTAMAYAVVHETHVPPSRLVPGLPPALDRFFDRALAKRPEERFATGEAFAGALQGAAAGATGADAVPAAEKTICASPALAPSAAAGAGRVLSAAASAGARGVAGAARATARMAGAAGRGLAPVGRTLARAGRQRLERLSPQGRMLLLAGLFALAAAGVWTTWSLASRATVVVTVKNSFPSGTLTVSVDGTPVYVRGLSAERKNMKAFGRKLLEWGQEEFETRLRVPPGRHDLLVEVDADGEPAAHRQPITLNVEPGETRRLRLTLGKNKAPLSVKLD